MAIFIARTPRASTPTLYSELKSACDTDGIFTQLVIGDIVKFITEDHVQLLEKGLDGKEPFKTTVQNYLVLHNATLIGSSHPCLSLEMIEKNFRKSFGVGMDNVAHTLKGVEFNRSHSGHKHLLQLLTQLASLHAVEHIDDDRKKARDFRKKRVDILTQLFTIFDSAI
jgi:hypothetical protein